MKETIGIISDNVNKQIINQTGQTISYLEELLEKMTGKIVKEISALPKSSEPMEMYIDRISELILARVL